MHSLFSLITFFIANQAVASIGTLEFTVAKENQIQIQEIDVPKESQTILIQSNSILNHYKISLGYTQEKQDLSTRNLVDKNGLQTRLSQYDNGTRKILSPVFEFSFSSHNINYSFSQDVAPSLLTESSRSLSYQFLGYNGATIFNLNLTRLTKDLPDSYFTDPESLQKNRRKTRIEGDAAAVSIEQILHELVKAKFEYKQLTLKDFRPRRDSFIISDKIALNSRWTIENSFGTAAESKKDSLSDDRGYFAANWLELGAIYEWTLDSFVSFAWGTSQETESDSRRNLETRLGNDTFSASLEHSLKEFSYSLAIASSRSSEGDSAVSGKGGIKWEF